MFEMPGEAAAFELVQKSRPRAGAVFFQRGARFVVIEAEGLDQRGLDELAAAFEKGLP
jgi:hypothetical protein